ncbi:amino acid ABC transporter substrate-binding protein (PAAT family) [Hasllibacter halocynthiae]|uniref:Amino acid ABC transporter substrate-binding protein (PAAT family) n=1 Tax=Hasllibacter halocynthiae TaxID=595589 RepID=A0A2T0X6Y0_9RHOB|nr:transporter substrate-binding domain-containing protein [Hasllibacter halocynthiae]PRY94689.1 amino acid ABC transporter substrate-binding protein (PAAT family) [Hasllibacter halocynthiae]
MIRTLLLLAALLGGPTAAVAQVPAPGPSAAALVPDVLRVGVIDRPPYASVGEDGLHSGFVVGIWRLVAERLGTQTEWVTIERAEVRAAVASGLVDLALPVDAAAPLEVGLDLTHPLHSSHVGVVSKAESRIWSTVRGLASTEFLRIVAGLALLLLAVGALVWALERRSNGEQFQRDPVRGLGDGFWWAGVTLTTIGYGDKAPATVAGRAVAMLWMLAGLAVSAALTAAVINVSNAGSAPELPEDLRGYSVLALPEGAAAAFLAREDIDAGTREDAEALLQAVADGEADRAVGAAPALRAALSGSDLNLQVRETLLDPVLVAVALPEGSPLREPLNRAILEVVTSEAGIDLIRRYLPED